MIEDVPAALGMPLNEVDTPSLLIDLDAFERNLRRMAEAAQHRRGRVAAACQNPQITCHCFAAN